ncbi:zinc finger protein interacting with ribonucleoprotein K-like, partial [Ctenocephalides felis]|uniref:zinc finger protein interacting with ribonucleoprotein K-like n=1 Tax=Ctenocephalides felis TaxID=7515 RepID=UPI000E6E2BCC
KKEVYLRYDKNELDKNIYPNGEEGGPTVAEDYDYSEEIRQSKSTDPTEFDYLSALQNDINKTTGRLASSTYKNDKETDGEIDLKHRLHFVKYVKRNDRTIKLWECGVCSREFQHQYTLMRHLPTHTDVRNYQCTQCNKAFRQLSTLSQHKAIHSMERPYECEVHTDAATKMKFRCNYCEREFSKQGQLQSHEMKKHGVTIAKPSNQTSQTKHRRNNNSSEKTATVTSQDCSKEIQH